MVALQQRKAVVNGHRFSYDNETTILVQTGKGRSVYHTEFVTRGNLTQAINKYKKLKLKEGEKKRLVIPSSNHPVVARQVSQASLN